MDGVTSLRGHRPYAVVALLSLLATACTVPPLAKGDRDFPAGTVMTLHTEIHVPDGQVGGQVGPGVAATLQTYGVTCTLQTRTVSDGVTTIRPDTFTVVGTNVDRELLSSGGGKASGFTPTALVYTIRNIYLTSPQQPDVLRLNCVQITEGGGSQLLPTRLVLGALGESMTITR